MFVQIVKRGHTYAQYTAKKNSCVVLTKAGCSQPGVFKQPGRTLQLGPDCQLAYHLRMP